MRNCAGFRALVAGKAGLPIPGSRGRSRHTDRPRSARPDLETDRSTVPVVPRIGTKERLNCTVPCLRERLDLPLPPDCRPPRGSPSVTPGAGV
jgi:hypothetical protein